ncbi:hypothetical protein BDR05DRAFT_948490 [Suillus weaverae]|nr:hypothetical protein BDR05DRAFT_948490 [Suillus weaverae]
MAKVMGRLTSNKDSELDDDTACKIFSKGLQQMSPEGIHRATHYKEAELEYHRHLSMTLAWEAEKLSRLRHFIDCEQQEQEDHTNRAFEEAALFLRMVADHDSEHTSKDLKLVTSIQQEEIERINQLNDELGELDLFLPSDLLASDLEPQGQGCPDHLRIGTQCRGGMAPHAAGPDRIQCSFAPEGDVVSRYWMVYTYLPLRRAEKSRQEYTDGMVFRDETTGIEKTTTRRYPLPPVRPPRESIVSDSDPTPVATACRPTAVNTSAAPSISEADSKTIVKDAKNSIIVETLNNCGFHNSSSRSTVVQRALTDTCSRIITGDQMIKCWVSDNVSKLYKSVITPMSTILNHFKQSAQDLVENLYNLTLSIWTDSTVQMNHNKTTVELTLKAIAQAPVHLSSIPETEIIRATPTLTIHQINFIFGNQVRLEDGREFRFPFEHEAIIQIAIRAAFRDGYDQFIDSDTSLDNIMALSAIAACCGLREFLTVCTQD